MHVHDIHVEDKVVTKFIESNIIVDVLCYNPRLMFLVLGIGDTERSNFQNQKQ